jgi:hypothetical protein
MHNELKDELEHLCDEAREQRHNQDAILQYVTKVVHGFQRDINESGQQ